MEANHFALHDFYNNGIGVTDHSESNGKVLNIQVVPSQIYQSSNLFTCFVFALGCTIFFTLYINYIIKTKFYRKAPEEPHEDTDIIREHGLLSTDIKAEFPSADKVFLEKGEFNIFNHQWNRQASVTCRSDQLPTIEEDSLLSGKLPSKRSHEKVSAAGSICSVPPKSPSEFSIGSGLQATRQQPSQDSLVFISGENLAANEKGLKQAGSALSAHSEVMKCASAGDTSEKPVFVSCANAEELLKSQAYQVLIEQEKCLLSRELSVDER